MICFFLKARTGVRQEIEQNRQEGSDILYSAATAVYRPLSVLFYFKEAVCFKFAVSLKTTAL